MQYSGNPAGVPDEYELIDVQTQTGQINYPSVDHVATLVFEPTKSTNNETMDKLAVRYYDTDGHRFLVVKTRVRSQGTDTAVLTSYGNVRPSHDAVCPSEHVIATGIDKQAKAGWKVAVPDRIEEAATRSEPTDSTDTSFIEEDPEESLDLATP
jgi:hypothetical protein